jgi:hypothetical protein
MSRAGGMVVTGSTQLGGTTLDVQFVLNHLPGSPRMGPGRERLAMSCATNDTGDFGLELRSQSSRTREVLMS